MVFRARVFASYLFIFLRAVGYFNPFRFFFLSSFPPYDWILCVLCCVRTMFRHAISILAIISYACNWTRGCNRFVKVDDVAEEEEGVVNWSGYALVTACPSRSHIRWGLNAKHNFNRLNINNSLIQLPDYYYYYYYCVFTRLAFWEMLALTLDSGLALWWN